MFNSKRKFIFGGMTVVVIAVATFFIFSGSKSVKNIDKKIGVILPLSGDLANIGADVKAGINIFAGINPDAKFMIEDDGGESKKAISAMRKLADVDNVKIFLGPLGPVSSETVYSSQTKQEKDNLVFVAMSMCAEQFKNYENMICNYPSPYFQLKESYRYPVSLGKKSFYTIVSNDSFGENILQMLGTVSKELGLDFIGNVKVNSNDLEFSTVVQKVIQNNPEFITIATANQPANIKIIKAIKERKYKGMILSGGDFNEKTVKDFKDILEGVYMAGQAKLDYDSKFVNEYIKKQGGTPNLYNAFGYVWGEILYNLTKSKHQKQFSVGDIMNYVNSSSGSLAIKGMLYDAKNKSVKFPMQIFLVEDGNLKSVFVSGGE